ncbi:MAG: Tad domain-containing protein [Cyanobacteria bacterium TGS_CYA1]|nr:Tad domain-containing protein [Cyanobacteria bacterium TGS_CYA1]
MKSKSVAAIMSQRSKRGSLVIPIAVFLGVILLAGLIFIIFMQMTSHQKQAQTAVDASVLAVAKEIGKVTIDDPGLGRIGVVDDYSNLGLAGRPVYGINTVMARCRLDLIIARRLNNTTMEFLVKDDSKLLGNATRRLNNLLCSANANGIIKYEDASGVTRTVNLAQVAADAYNSSGLRPASVEPVTAADITIEVGRTNSAGVTNIPVPSPLSRAEVNLTTNAATVNQGMGQQTFYRSNIPVPVSGSDTKFVFSQVGETVALIDRASFTPASTESITTGAPIVFPTTVRVTVKEKVRAIAGGDGKNVTSKPTEIKKEIACACAGNRRITPTAGIFRLEFPQGVPAQDNGVKFDTILSLMNSSMLPADAGSSSSPGTSGWKGNGHYFTSKKGPFPGSGSIARSDVAGRKADNPSVALAFFVYDWLRNESLRPNVDAVYNAMHTKLRGNELIKDQVISYNFDLMQKAYAAENTNPACNVFGGIFALVPNSDQAMTAGNDPRSLNNFNDGTRNIYLDQAMVFRMQATVPQQLAWAPPHTMAHGKGKDDRPTTTDGNPISELLDFREDLIKMMQLGRDTAVAGGQVAKEQADIIAKIVAEIDAIVDKQNEISDQMQDAINAGNMAEYQSLQQTWNDWENKRRAKVAEMQEPTRKYNRGLIAYSSGVRAINLGLAIINNLLAVTALGVDKIEPLYYHIAGNNDFFPPGRAATVSEIVGTGPAATGQNKKAGGDEDWLGSPFFVKNLSGVAMSNCPESVIPTSQSRNFKLTTQGDASKGEGGGVILLSIGDEVPVPIKPVTVQNIDAVGGFNNWARLMDPASKNNFSQVTGISSLLEDQLQYQSLNIYAEPDPVDNRLVIVWSVMGQNNVRNQSGADVRNPDQEGNMLDCSLADHDLDKSQQACRNEAVRFQITSPLLIVPPFPPVEIPPAPPGLPPVPSPRVPPVPPPPPQSH